MPGLMNMFHLKKIVLMMTCPTNVGTTKWDRAILLRNSSGLLRGKVDGFYLSIFFLPVATSSIDEAPG